MIELILQKNNTIKIITEEYEFLKDVKEFFTEFVDGCFFMPLYKSGQWDGKISLFKNNCIPFGLFKDFLTFYRENYKNLELKIDPNLLKMYKGDIIDFVYDLKFKPYPYQQKAIENAVKFRNGLFLIATAGGKSVCLTYIFKNLYDNKKISNVILVVPTINLVNQFKSDMIDYGIDENLIGECYGDIKEWNKTIVISTWQTLHNNLDKLEVFDAIFVDEVHQVRSDSLIEILKNCPHMLYRIGCTGTLPDNRLDLLNIKSYLGPVTSYFPVKYLIEEGYIADCTVKIFNIEYINEIKGDYNQVKDEVFGNRFRLNFISNQVTNIKDNILLLVGKIEKEGEILENHLKSIPELKDRQIKFIYGKTKPVDREEWRQKCIKENNIILIAIFQVFQAGVNIPNLKHIFFTSSNKAKIRTLQSIGRGLRKSKGQTATIYDIVDHSNKFLSKHALERQKFYEKDNFHIEFVDVKEI